MLLVILLGAGEIPNGLFLVALLATAALSIAFALVALGFAGRQRDAGMRVSIVVVALVVLVAFFLAAVAIFNAFGDALN